MNQAASESALLDVRDLSVEFSTEIGTTTAIRDVSFELGRGETVAIVGESGSGKSTTVNAILGLLAGNGRVRGGAISFRGQDISRFSESRMRSIRGLHLGLVPQDPMSNLNPALTIGDQVSEVLLTHKKAHKADVFDEAVAVLQNAGLPNARAQMKQYPHQLSGGMRQRVLIAIGLACTPELLIADEPTSALDVTVQKQILDHLGSMTRDLGTALLLITHDLGLAAERCERVIVMYKGEIVEQGDATKILRDPQHEYTKRLVASAPSIASARLVPDQQTIDRENQVAERPVVLEVKELRKTFRVYDAAVKKRTDFVAVDDVSFVLNEASTLAIVGESGSGKTTTARMILRLDDPTSGSIETNGTNIATLSGRELKALRARMQPIFQDPYASLNPMTSVGNLLKEPLIIHGIGDGASRRNRAHELLDMVALDRSMYDRYASELSGGQRQRVAIARALALEPGIILCDEPVSALDVLVQAQVLELLTGLQRELGLSYLFISHDLAVVRLIADEVIVMRRGEIVERGITTEVFENPQHEYTRNLLGSIPGAAIL